MVVKVRKYKRNDGTKVVSHKRGSPETDLKFKVGDEVKKKNSVKQDAGLKAMAKNNQNVMKGVAKSNKKDVSKESYRGWIIYTVKDESNAYPFHIELEKDNIRNKVGLAIKDESGVAESIKGWKKEIDKKMVSDPLEVVPAGWRKVKDANELVRYRNLETVFGRVMLGDKEIHIGNERNRFPAMNSDKWRVNYVENSYSEPEDTWTFDTLEEAKKKAHEIMLSYPPKRSASKDESVVYDMVIKEEFVDSSFPIPVLPASVVGDAENIFLEMNNDYEKPFEIERGGRTYRYKGDIFYSDINLHVNSKFKRSVYRSEVYDYVHAKLVRAGYYIHS